MNTNGFIPVVRAGKMFGPDAWLEEHYGNGATLHITAEVSHLQGGQQDPHFSVTGEVRRPRSRDIEAGGCLHDEALRYWPELAPIVALHLSSAKDGAPMYAEANGWYWLAGALGGFDERFHGGNSKGNHGGEYRNPTRAECLRIFADHVRVTEQDAMTLVARLDQAAEHREPCAACAGNGVREGLPCATCRGTGLENDAQAYRRAWKAECAAMAPRWMEECRTGLAWLLKHGTPSDLRAEWFKRVPQYTGHNIAELADATT